MQSILQTTKEGALLAIERECTNALDLMRDQDTQSEFDFARTIEKSLLFAEWISRIFYDEHNLSIVIARYRNVAYTTFVKNLRLSERTGWNFIDAVGQTRLTTC